MRDIDRKIPPFSLGLSPDSGLEPRAAEQPAGLLREGDQVLGAEQADVELPIQGRKMLQAEGDLLQVGIGPDGPRRNSVRRLAVEAAQLPKLQKKLLPGPSEPLQSPTMAAAIAARHSPTAFT